MAEQLRKKAAMALALTGFIASKTDDSDFCRPLRPKRWRSSILDRTTPLSQGSYERQKRTGYLRTLSVV